MAIVLFASMTFLSGTACRKAAPEFGSQCKRLNDCFTAYSKDVTDAKLKTAIEGALNLADEGSCASSLSNLGKVPEIQKQGGCPF